MTDTAKFESVIYAVEEGLATITMNRPDALNAYTLEMGEELVAAFHAARDDARVRAIILTGAGRGFCAGVDLEHLRRAHAEGVPSDSGPKLGEEDFVRKLPLELLDFPKPTLAAINGHAIGVGITMALPLDLRLAADGAKLGLTFVKLGILPGLGSTHLLPRLVGLARAQELVMSGRIILADEAERIGLVGAVHPSETLMDETRRMARALAEIDPDVLVHARRALRRGAELPMDEAMKSERSLSASLRARRADRSAG